MKKTFIFMAMAALAALCFTACGSDDDDYVAPQYKPELPLPQYANDAVSFEKIKNMDADGMGLKSITFTESGNAIVETGGEFVSAKYTVANGVYTLTGAAKGTVRENTTKGTSSEGTNLSINIEIVIDGVTYNFTGDADADKQTSTELLGNVDLNNICRKWYFKNMALSLSGDVSMMKTYTSGDMSQLGKDANENGAGLTADELAELNKTILALEFTKSGKLYLSYKEDGAEVTQCATWNSTDYLNFLINEISEANKFIDKNSKIQVIYNATGGCTITFFTTIKGTKRYDAQLTVNME